jgi:hypothetical protein
MHRHFLPFDDPAALEGSEDDVLAGFRRISDEIHDRLEDWLASV